MKIFAALLCACLLMGLATNAVAAAKIDHVVCFKFKASASPQDIKKVEEAFQALAQKLPQVSKFKWGTNISKEQRDKGFTHCFIVTFKSEKDRDAYLSHPDHKAFASSVGPVVDDIFVIDFKTK
jgi:hypothetical protein